MDQESPETDYQATLEHLVETNAQLIDQALAQGVRPEMMYVMAGLDTLKRVIAGNQESFLAINCHHEETFQAQLREALKPRLVVPD